MNSVHPKLDPIRESAKRSAEDPTLAPRTPNVERLTISVSAFVPTVRNLNAPY